MAPLATTGAEQWEADVTELAKRTGDRWPATARPGERGWIDFDIHGCLGMRVAHRAPTAPQFTDMFAPFRTKGSGRVDLTVTNELLPMQDAAYAEHEYRYTSALLYLMRSKVQIAVEGEGFRLGGNRELLTSALPLIDRILVRRGMAMIHAAAFEYRGHGVALPAWGGVGKTSTIAKLTRLPQVGFMGDDWAFLGADGRVLGYAKPMFIKPHHRPIYPHLFAARRKPLVPSALSAPMARFTTMVHPVVTQYPRLAAFSRRWSPEHMMVTPEQALPHARLSTAAPLAVTVFVERFDGDRPVLQHRDARWMVARMVGNFHAELPSHSRDVLTALGATGMLPLEQFHAEKAAVLAEGLAGTPTFLLQVPAACSADKASDVIVDQLLELLDGIGVS
jgi:hypothetical protein